MWELAVPVAIGVIAVFVIGLMFARLYRRSTRDEAYVRTGLGGQKVVLDGGSIVLPVFHSTAAVNLKTLRLEVARGGPDSLITKDRMRVDIGAEFYLRVKPDMSSIALAAQTLGNRTNDAAELRELVEAKFVDGLRSVAATMNLEELQEQRATFVKAVQDAVGADIQNNGLELESVSLTRLDQSDIKHFNPSNFFDAHGLTTLTKITKEREQERNQIVRTTEVNIAQQDLVARQTTLTIESTKREAELAQQRDIANKTAAMRAQTAQVEQTALQNEAEYRIQQELAVANKQTEANQARDTRKIEADLAVKRRTTEMERELQIVAQEAAIVVATKSKEQSEAQTIAETARALAIAAEEKVTTARATEIAERDKIINVIAARKAAETNAMPITVMAEAEKQAAANKAEAINVLAKADANAATTRAAGVKSLGQAEAEVATLKAEARNKLSPAMIDYDLNLARINIIPNALAEAVKPIEKISDIRIFDTGSLLGRGGAGGGSGGGWRPRSRRRPCRQLLSVSAFKPIIDKILTEAGFAAGPDALTSLTNALAAQQLANPAEPPATPPMTLQRSPAPHSVGDAGKAVHQTASSRARLIRPHCRPEPDMTSANDDMPPRAHARGGFFCRATCRETGGFARPRSRTMLADRQCKEFRHVRRRHDPPARDLQPPRLVQSRRPIGRADRAGRGPHRRGAAARRRRRPDRAVADRADPALHPVCDSRRPARRPHLAALADGGRGSAARRGAAGDPRADLAWLADAATPRAARLHRRLRHRRLQRRSACPGALAGDARSCCRRPTHGSSWRAPSPSPAGPRSAACWSDGSVLRPRSDLPRHCR